MLKMADEGGKGGVGGVVSQMLTIVDVGGSGGKPNADDC